MANTLSPEHIKSILEFQKTEVTEALIYRRLSLIIKDKGNSAILRQIADDEERHARIWMKYSRQPVKPNLYRVWVFIVIARVFGLTFSIKLLEKTEQIAQGTYEEIAAVIPEARAIAREENSHEHALIGMINEERLKYVGSIVLGLNDALVELTGALAGLTLAFNNSRLVATAGFITGIAASFSMAASEYLSTRSEGGDHKDPIKASVYTGIAYVATVLFLIIPYMVFQNIYVSLFCTLFNALIVIFVFTFYVSIAQDLPFRRRFLEMAGLSFGVALLSFGIGFAVRHFTGIEF